MRTKTYELYITKNLITGCVYGGKHTYTTKRGKYLGSGYRLKRAIKKYGAANFSVKILRLHVENDDELNKKEIRLIRLLRHIFKDKCYNLHRGGSGGNYYMYLDVHERQEINMKISTSKKRQYSEGQTDAQIQGRLKQSSSLKKKLQDPEYYAFLLEKQKQKGRTLSLRIQKNGFTDKEIERNRKKTENGIRQITYQIIIPELPIVTETLSSKKFRLKYKTDDYVYTRLRIDGMYVFTRRTTKTKHEFPVGTIIKKIS